MRTMRTIANTYSRYRRLSDLELLPRYYKRRGEVFDLLNREVLITNLLVYDYGYEAVEQWIRTRVVNESSAARVKKA